MGNIVVERVMGIEPTSKAWEALVLPLNYTRRDLRTIGFGRSERIRTSGFYVPNVALYQAELHSDPIIRQPLELLWNCKHPAP
jgi:hypothetical protein